MNTSINAAKAFEKIQHIFRIKKKPQETETEGTFPTCLRAFLKNLPLT